MGKKKYTDIYIAEDGNGLIRISCKRDASLARARWRKTDAMAIYGRGNQWYGSCRMSSSARKDFYKAGLDRLVMKNVDLDGAICAFAEGLVKLEALQNSDTALPRSTDLCLGEWNDDNGRRNLVAQYRGFFAKVVSVRLDYPSPDYQFFLAVYCGGKLRSMIPLKARNYNGQVTEITSILDEVADGREKRNRRSRGASGSRASSEANR